MGSTGHLSARRGQRVIVHMRDGMKYVGKFKEHKHTYITLDLDNNSDLALMTSKIRTVSIYKPSPELDKD